VGRTAFRVVQEALTIAMLVHDAGLA